MMTVAQNSDQPRRERYGPATGNEKHGGNDDPHDNHGDPRYSNSGPDSLPGSYFLSTAEWLAIYRGV
jgi:hypothetical protein